MRREKLGAIVCCVGVSLCALTANGEALGTLSVGTLTISPILSGTVLVNSGSIYGSGTFDPIVYTGPGGYFGSSNPYDTAVDPCGAPAFDTVKIHGEASKVNIDQKYLPAILEEQAPGAPLEALKAIAVADRSMLYYSIEQKGYVGDGGQLDYEDAPSATSSTEAAAEATAREVITQLRMVQAFDYTSQPIIGYAVQGATPSKAGSAPLGVAEAGDPDPTNTEKDVTYNQSLTGYQVHQTPLGADKNTNHGAMSIAGAEFLAKQGYTYQQILQFYYGDARVTVGDSGYSWPSFGDEVAASSASGLTRLNPTSPLYKPLDNFENDSGYLINQAAANSTTINRGTFSVERTSDAAHSGKWSEQVVLYSIHTGKEVTFTQSSGIAGGNMVLSPTGTLGFWAKTKTQGMWANPDIEVVPGVTLGPSEAVELKGDNHWHLYEFDLSALSPLAGAYPQSDNSIECVLNGITFVGHSDARLYLDDLGYEPDAGQTMGSSHAAEAMSIGVLVPEPSTMCVGAVGMFYALGRRRRTIR